MGKARPQCLRLRVARVITFVWTTNALSAKTSLAPVLLKFGILESLKIIGHWSYKQLASNGPGASCQIARAIWITRLPTRNSPSFSWEKPCQTGSSSNVASPLLHFSLQQSHDAHFKLAGELLWLAWCCHASTAQTMTPLPLHSLSGCAALVSRSTTIGSAPTGTRFVLGQESSNVFRHHARPPGDGVGLVGVGATGATG